MDKAELLNRFVTVETGFRDYLKVPFLLGDFVYATNGHCAIRVPRDGLDFKEVENEGVKKIDELFAKASAHIAFAQIPELPPPNPCRQCEGAGTQVECDDCEGDGDFEHGMHTYECKECEGSGQVSGERGKSVPCRNCDGAGTRINQPVSVGVASYDRRYLAKIIGIPRLRFSPAPYPDTAYFTFDGGEGLLMPMRV